MRLSVEMRLFGMEGAHCRADVRGASRQRGLARVVMPSAADSSDRSDSVQKTAFSWRGQCRPLRWPAASWTRPVVEAWTLVDARQVQLFDGVDDLLQVLLGQMQISGCHLQVLMTEQKLDGTQVSARFQ